MSALHLACLTECGPTVGLGHLSRCLALAKAAAQMGGRVRLLLAGSAPSEAPWSGALAVERLDWIADLPAALAALRRLQPDAIAVDSYAATTAHFAALRALGPVIALDDLADRPLPVDVIVNGSVAAESLPYDRAGDARLLLGPRYAPLDPDYAAPPRRRGERIERVLICLGGSRQDAVLHTAVEAVDRAVAGAAVDVVTGPFGTAEMEMAIGRGLRNRVVFHRQRSGLRELMIQADLGISGAGVSLAELAATGTPAVAVLLAPNQRPNYEAFVRAGTALAAGAAGDAALGGAIESACVRLTEDPALRASMSARGRALVDGGGAARVVQAIGQLAVARR